MRTRLAYERGDQAEVKRLLHSKLPRNLGPQTPLDEDQLKMIRVIGAISLQYGEYELAKQLLGLYTRRKPEGTFDLLTVMALHGDAEQAMGIMQTTHGK